MNYLHLFFGRAARALRARSSGCFGLRFARCFARASRPSASLTLLCVVLLCSTVARGNLNYTTEQVATLQSIAAQCPLAGGKAVSKARGMLSVLEDSDFDDYELCNSIGLQPMIKPNEEIAAHFSVYPNPASSVLTVQYQIEQKANIYILDVLGRQVISVALNPVQNLLNVDISGLPSGIYLYKISNEDGEILLSSSVVVSK